MSTSKVITACLALLFFYTVPPPARGQRIAPCDASSQDTFRCDNVRLVRQVKTAPNRPPQEGIRVNNRFLPCSVCRLNEVLVFGFGQEFSVGARLDLDCPAAEANHPFNGHYQGQRHGIWLQRNVFGVLKRATLYEAGERLKVIRFWPNGQPRQLTLYRAGHRRLSGGKLYDRQGFVQSGPF